jgi:DNA-directed RNA polymerase subunit RPC12/RpoP
MICGFCGTKLSPNDVTLSEDEEDGYYIGEHWQEETDSYSCNNCGAQVLSGESVTATFCAYCGSPAIIMERISGGAKPVRIIPFTFGREETEKEFLKWCSGKKLLPRKFTSKKNIGRLTGMYVPFWLFDYAVDVNAWQELVYVEKNREGASTVGTFSGQKSGLLIWEKVPVVGSSKMDSSLMEMIEPYNYSQLRAFEMSYLAGFFAERYDIQKQLLNHRIKNRVKQFVQDAVLDAQDKSTLELKYEDLSIYHAPVAEYVLMPVWFMNYKYMGKTFTFLLNGQTGKVAGDIPTSWGKIGLIALGAYAVLAPLLYWLGGLIL